jgi:hypothetical protein
MAESWQSQNSEPRSDSILRACLQVAQRPTVARRRSVSRSARLWPGSVDFEVALISCFAVSLLCHCLARFFVAPCCLALSPARSLAFLPLAAFLCWCSLSLDQALQLCFERQFFSDFAMAIRNLAVLLLLSR